MRAVAAFALGVCAARAAAAASVVTKLGIYDYFTDESSPVIYNGQLIMFESIVQDSPQWAGHWLPSFANCTSYFRVRNQLTGEVIQNISQTCDHAFGEAFVATNDEGLDTMFVFGTPWIRAQSPAPPPPQGWPLQAAASKRLGWGGPCAQGNCSVDVFVSSDPTLQSWTDGVSVVRMPYSVYNNDVCHVGVPSAAAAEAAKRGQGEAGAVNWEWVMILEDGGKGTFFVSNLTDPSDPTGWSALDPGTYALDTFGNGQIGSCPSIRYDPSSGYFYVLTGGYQIIVLRSKSLMTGSWELGSNNGVLLNPDVNDCILATPPYGGWFNLTAAGAAAQGHVQKCLANPTGPGFGNDSDVDLTEIIVDSDWLTAVMAGQRDGTATAAGLHAAALRGARNGTTGTPTLATLLQYGTGDQATFGFSNLAIYPGGLFAMLESYFQ